VDDSRLDDWARWFVKENTSRRVVLRALAGGTLVSRLAFRGVNEGAVACVLAGEACGRGNRCCDDATCDRGRGHCIPGLPACCAGVWGGGPGRKLGFGWVFGVAVSSGGHVYVSDFDNDRILKFTADGELVTSWGRRGGRRGQFRRPMGVAVAPDRTVYVTDAEKQRFDRRGAFLGQ
jgi:hypothetical protein